MFASLKQLLADLQDKTAGEKISRWPVKTPLFLWTKFFAILVVIILLSVIYSLVYFVPQIPKFISQSVPNVTVSVQNNILTLTPNDPYKLISPEGSIVIDTREQPDDYSYLPVGVFVYRDHSETIDKDGTRQRFDFQNLPNFSLSKPQLVSWFTENKTRLILILIPASILLAAIISAFVWLFRVLGFYFWSGLIYLALKIFNRSLAFSQILPIVIYASILPLLISYILFFAPHPLLSLLNFILFVFFTFSWLMPLTKINIIPTPKKIIRKK